MNEEKRRMTLSLLEAAEEIGVGETKMRELVHTKGFPAIKVGKSWRIATKGLEAWIEKKAEEGAYL